jgi:cysteine synthase A
VAGSIQQLVQCIGNTPLIRLNRLSDKSGCEILGKGEFLNPGGSVKDRTALGIILDAKQSGALQPGGVIVEGTAGNTGIGLALAGNALGHRTIIVMPDNQSKEKIAALKAFGAEVRMIPPVPYKNPEHFVHTSGRLVDAMNADNPGSAFWANQFENLANRRYHEKTTGREIWQQTDGKVDGFVCSVGTGGTLAGVSRALRKENDRVVIALSDPGGSGLHNYYAHGEIRIEGSSISEGIGNSRIPANLGDTVIDKSWQIPDEDALDIVYRLIRDEGMVLGGSSGINLAGAMRLANELGPGHTIVTVLCDSGMRYQERLFNADYLASKGLAMPDWLQTML